MPDDAFAVVLYILFGVLLIVFSHLQERLQRKPDGECLLGYYCVSVSSNNDTCIDVDVPPRVGKAENADHLKEADAQRLNLAL
ncbi:hypothetical protein B0H14DRAFT_3441404 [Mycena olivaceomarginata]|nr:hypothetical protein B0H14DRAFT_3441404 [Mycena olivaceomarginata]